MTRWVVGIVVAQIFMNLFFYRDHPLQTMLASIGGGCLGIGVTYAFDAWDRLTARRKRIAGQDSELPGKRG